MSEDYPIDLGKTYDVDDLATQDGVGAVLEDVVPASPLPMPPPVASLKSNVNNDSPLLECLDSVLSNVSNDSWQGNPDFAQSPLQSEVPQLPVQHSLDTALGVVRPKDFSCPKKLCRCNLCSPSQPPMHALVSCHLREPWVLPPRESPVSVSVSSGPPVIVFEAPASVPKTPYTPSMVLHQRESFTKSGPRTPDVASKPPPVVASQGIVTQSSHVLGSTRHVTDLSTASLPPQAPCYGCNGTQGHGYVAVPSA